jgi:predicted short-subunit dehydrogenase-like oxidoreductase (DUF2520 family)
MTTASAADLAVATGPGAPPHRPRLAIIGPGRVGKALGRLFHDSGAVVVGDILARHSDSAAAAVAFIGAGRPLTDFNLLEPADIFMLSVADDQIGACAGHLAKSRLASGSIVFHCSGALTAAVLAPAQQAGAHIASIHPVRSFADPAAVASTFAGTFCGVEGDGPALATLLPLMAQIGARPVAIDPAQKTIYHAAAVFASNYLVTLIDVATQAYGQAGITPELALEMIAPLLRESAENTFRLGPRHALTGPIARGDSQTVERQQQALASWNPAYAALYAQFATLTQAMVAGRQP